MQMMSPIDVMFLEDLRRRFESIARLALEDFDFARTREFKPEPRSNYRLLERGAFELRQRLYLGAIPDGDGWAPVVEDERWNGPANPLANTIRVRAMRKQAAARALVKWESRDDRRILVKNEAGEWEFQPMAAEARPANFVRRIDWDSGAKYAGGRREVLRTRREQVREVSLEMSSKKPEPRVEESSRELKIQELERQLEHVKRLLGVK